MHLAVLTWSRSRKRLVVIAVDVVLSLLATWLAFSLRLDTFNIPTPAQARVYALIPFLAIPVFIRFGLYRAIFRYTGQAAMVATAQAIAVFGAVLSALLFFVQWPMVPRSVGILQPLIFLILVGASRAMARFWLAGLSPALGATPRRLLIFGAGTAGVQTAVAMSVSRQFQLMGFVDDDPAKVGRSINGVTVSDAAQLHERVLKDKITDILLAQHGRSGDGAGNGTGLSRARY